MASRKQRGSGVGFSKSKKANTKKNKKNNKKNTKKNKPKNADANMNFNANVNFNSNNGYNKAMAMGQNVLRQLQSQINPNNVRQLERNLQNAYKYSEQMNELTSRPLKPMTKAEKNALEQAYANLEREIAEGKA
jgi:hypothetical protein